MKAKMLIGAVACLIVGFMIGRSTRAQDYIHGHTDGLLAGIFEEYNRAVIQDTTDMDENALEHHKNHLDFLERRVEDIFKTATVPFSPELQDNWNKELKPMRKNVPNQASQVTARKLAEPER